MEFEELFREKYRVALLAVRINDQDGVIDGLSNLCALFAEQYSKNNGDSIVIKAKLSYWQDTLIRICKSFGNTDCEISEFKSCLDLSTMRLHRHFRIFCAAAVLLKFRLLNLSL